MENNLPKDYVPSYDEPFMCERQKEFFRIKLQEWKDRLLKETENMIGSLKEGGLGVADIADRASVEADNALELRTKDRARKLISKINAALVKIEEGTYGFCEETGEPISLERLIARPIATLSIEAQERHERMERVYNDDLLKSEE